MNKSKNNIVNTNPTIIDVLKQNISKKLENQDKLVKIEKLYIVFFNTSIFRICREVKTEGEYCDTYELNDFFTDSLVDFAVSHKKERIVLPWTMNDEFSLLDGEKAVAIPIKTFLGSHVLKDVTTKKNVIAIYDVINEYLKEHPNAIESIFVEKSNQKHI